MQPLIIDSFAGGGGASTGIELALGRSPDYAIDHDGAALAMHEANHPETVHLKSDIWGVEPLDVTKGRPVGLLWASPDCKHFSKARGGAPRDSNIRDLAWIVVKWAEQVKPDVIIMENVGEFVTWGPIGEDGQPIKEFAGQTFDLWKARLRKAGYRLRWEELRACDYGDPTIRKRFVMVARRDGRPIVIPKPTHGAPDSQAVKRGKLQPFRTAAECVDWSLPCPSIFDTSEEIMEKHGLRAVRPLADNTLRRIARGVQRYVIEAKKPFIVVCNHAGEGFRGQGLDDPLATITAARDAVIAPHLMTMRNAGKPFTAGDEPTHTLTAGGAHMMAVSAFLAQHNGGPRNEGSTGRAADAPLSTVTVRGTQQTLVAANMISMHGSSRRDGEVDDPVPTITAGGGHAGMVAAFLAKYYGTDQDPRLDGPLHPLTTKDRFGLVTVEIAGEEYAIVDIGMRMLTPRELFTAQGFPPDYVIEGVWEERDDDWHFKPFTKDTQIKCVGNSVCPGLAKALVEANCQHLMANHLARQGEA